MSINTTRPLKPALKLLRSTPTGAIWQRKSNIANNYRKIKRFIGMFYEEVEQYVRYLIRESPTW